ncbi:MAG: hypothetical protein K2X53_01555 [Alphaproteobacteria bacterium]|nr:hypothetical protein [Alphaproteobacteria bacterium]
MKKNKKITTLIVLSVSLVACLDLCASRTYQIVKAQFAQEDTHNTHKRAFFLDRRAETCSSHILRDGLEIDRSVLKNAVLMISPVSESIDLMPSTREESISYVLRYLMEKIGEVPQKSKKISSEVTLANILMGETYFIKARNQYDDESLAKIFMELKEKTATCEPLKDYWPRIITMLAMNKMAHTPFFLPNKLTMIMLPFPPQLIDVIHKELKETQFNSVNAILYWMRSNYYVKWVREAPRAWDVHCISRRFAIVGGKWIYEDFHPRRLELGETLGSFRNYQTSPDNIEPLVCNKHFPQETAKLFKHRVEQNPDEDGDFLTEILMAKYLSWLAKAEKNGKKYMSFYDGGSNEAKCPAAEQNFQVSVVSTLHPHTRAQDMSGPFPGMYAYERMILRGFNQPPELFRTNATPYTQEELFYQATRYYVDAASRGLGTAIDYLRTRYSTYFTEHFIPMELEIADKKRSANALHTLSWVRNHKVDKASISLLREIAGIEEFKSEDTQKVSVMPPPSPRKTPAKKLQQHQNGQNGSTMPPPSPRKTPVKNSLWCDESALENKDEEKSEQKKEVNLSRL